MRLLEFFDAIEYEIAFRRAMRENERAGIVDIPRSELPERIPERYGGEIKRCVSGYKIGDDVWLVDEYGTSYLRDIPTK